MTKPDYAEFDNPRLARVYDSFNSLTDDRVFWLDKIKELGVQRIIDVGCGTGLLTCELAQLGYTIVGVEPAQAMLDLAQEKEGAKKVTWLLGSTEQLKGQKADLVIMTSHVAQFFVSTEEWHKALANIYEALEEGGVILFDSKNPLSVLWKNWSKENTQRTKTTPEGEVLFWIDAPVVDGNQVEYELHYLFSKDSEELVSKNALAYRPKDQIMEDLKTTGFQVENVYGNWNGDEYSEDSEEMIFLAKK